MISQLQEERKQVNLIQLKVRSSYAEFKAMNNCDLDIIF